ncbi:unnamed protein product [Schistosoma mansoni]|uniref:Smp_204760 n=1 Tax=Schistosoma mansoni TaxID=6183 RepID=UPI00022C865A|nr:unnamed protein product [Schistosoma mansoni]|eukprot:XP_018644666.1 unnamed protein product [Schistosoma mansoni]
MPSSKLHSYKTKSSNQNISQFKSIDNTDVYSCHSNTVDSKSFESINYNTQKITQLYYPLKHCKITNDNDLLYRTNIQHDKTNGQIKSQLQTLITKVPKSMMHKQIKFMEYVSEGEKKNTGVPTLKNTISPSKQSENKMVSQTKLQTSPLLTSIKHDDQYLKSTLINKPQHSSQVQLTNTTISNHNTLDKNLTPNYIDNIKSASISDLSRSSLRINHNIINNNNKPIKILPLLNKSSSSGIINTQLNDPSITPDHINNYQPSKITIIRENNNNNIKMNSYPKLPITNRSALKKDAQLCNPNHNNNPSYKSSISQSPLSNISCESLPNVNNSIMKFNSLSTTLNINNNNNNKNQLNIDPDHGLHNNHNHNNHITWKVPDTKEEYNSNEKLEVDHSTSENMMQSTNSSNLNKIGLLKQYNHYKSTPNIMNTTSKRSKTPKLTKFKEDYITHIARPLKPEFLNNNNNINHYNAFISEQDLSDRSAKINVKQYNRSHNELDKLHQIKNENPLNSYQQIIKKKPNGDNDNIDNIQLSTCRHSSYERNLNKKPDEDPINVHSIQPIIIQRHYASKNLHSESPSNHFNGHLSCYPSEESLINDTKVLNGLNNHNHNNNSIDDYYNYSQSLPYNYNYNGYNSMNDTKLSRIYRKINHKQPNRILPRRPRSLIQDTYNNHNHHLNLHQLSNELHYKHGHSYNNIYDNLIDHECSSYNESIDGYRSITPNLFRKYDYQQSYINNNNNNTMNDNISIINDDYNSYDYRCSSSNDIVNQIRTWTKTDHVAK